jgi:hypothetical protein
VTSILSFRFCEGTYEADLFLRIGILKCSSPIFRIFLPHNDPEGLKQVGIYVKEIAFFNNCVDCLNIGAQLSALILCKDIY